MKQIFRFKFYPREKASYIMLRRLGYSINILARAFGRSTSVLNRIFKRHHSTCAVDLRKFPNRMRRLYAARQWRTLMTLLHVWESFMLGEGDKPP